MTSESVSVVSTAADQAEGRWLGRAQETEAWDFVAMSWFNPHKEPWKDLHNVWWCQELTKRFGKTDWEDPRIIHTTPSVVMEQNWPLDVKWPKGDDKVQKSLFLAAQLVLGSPEEIKGVNAVEFDMCGTKDKREIHSGNFSPQFHYDKEFYNGCLEKLALLGTQGGLTFVSEREGYHINMRWLLVQNGKFRKRNPPTGNKNIPLVEFWNEEQNNFTCGLMDFVSDNNPEWKENLHSTPSLDLHAYIREGEGGPKKFCYEN